MWLKGYKSSFINLGHKYDLLRTVENHGAFLLLLRSELSSIQLGWISWFSVMTLKISRVTCTGQWCLHLWGKKRVALVEWLDSPITLPSRQGDPMEKWKIALHQNVSMAYMVGCQPKCYSSLLPHSTSFQANGTLIWFQYR